MKDAFFSLKTSKSPNSDEIKFHVTKHCFGELCGPLKYLFDSSLESEVFPNLLKIAIVSPVFKSDTADISNFCPTPVFPCFSKILECVMYNRLCKYLTDQKHYTQNSLLLERATLQNMQLHSLLIRSTNHLRTTTTPLVFLSTSQRRLIKSII